MSNDTEMFDVAGDMNLTTQPESVYAAHTSIISSSRVMDSDEIDRRIAKLAKDVAEVRLEIGDLENSDFNRWKILDERLRALEPEAESSTAGSGRHPATVRLKVVVKAECNESVNPSGAVGAPRPQTDENINPHAERHVCGPESVDIAIDHIPSIPKPPAPPTHPNDLSSGHLTVSFQKDGKLYLHMRQVTRSRQRLLFLGSRAQIRTKKRKNYPSVNLGYTVTELAPRPLEPCVEYVPGKLTFFDFTLIRTPGTYKILLKLYHHLHNRKAELVRKWKTENLHFVARLAPPQAYETIPKISPAFNKRRLKDVPRKIHFLEYDTLRHGLINMDDEGLREKTESARLLVRRVVSASPASVSCVYFDMSTGARVLRDDTDIVIEESEWMYERLGLMYQELDDDDLLEGFQVCGLPKPNKHDEDQGLEKEKKEEEGEEEEQSLESEKEESSESEKEQRLEPDTPMPVVRRYNLRRRR
ncbi:hypothetical protein GE09DRAFT_1212714 [Coniochaeta sp. 2T2.1]|nr:hypothetical protein GE09DRAFT_1212714 [Coniochaeta sp. 2T2.1]